MGAITIALDLHPLAVMTHFLLALAVLALTVVVALEAWSHDSGLAACGRAAVASSLRDVGRHSGLCGARRHRRRRDGLRPAPGSGRGREAPRPRDRRHRVRARQGRGGVRAGRALHRVVPRAHAGSVSADCCGSGARFWPFSSRRRSSEKSSTGRHSRGGSSSCTSSSRPRSGLLAWRLRTPSGGRLPR